MREHRRSALLGFSTISLSRIFLFLVFGIAGCGSENKPAALDGEAAGDTAYADQKTQSTPNESPVSLLTSNYFSVSNTETAGARESQNTQAKNQAPNGVIVQPADNVTIAVGASLKFAATGRDPDGNTPLLFQWDFGGGAANTTGAASRNVTFTTAGIFTVSLKVMDALGAADSTPDRVTVTVPAASDPPLIKTSHDGRFTTYEGAKTCIGCHATEVHQVHASAHYQLRGATPHVANMTVGGKLGAINDYCGFPDISWIGKLTNLDGVKVDGGCATCHAGMGLKPSTETTNVQLENIDCLMCHSKNYKRKVVQQTDGTFRFAPAPELMSVPISQAITDIQERPGRDTCVNCHAYAGGGCNNKRGDMEEAHRNPPSASFDVHMASRALGGAGLVCVDCHVTRDHRIAGRGVDLAVTDLDVPVRCTNCHATQPHGNAQLDRHTARVDCTVCHIPRFAKIATTDMIRDYSKPAPINAEKQLYDPPIERAGNVIPEYRFFNGNSRIYEFGRAAVLSASGRVVMAEPLGARTDVNAKLYAFKHHLAVQPHDPVSQRIIPQHMGTYFQTGDIAAAVKKGVDLMGWTLPSGYDFIPTERYQGIFHEVSPASEALRCADCHGGTRVAFATLGYTPKATRNGQPLCTSCHRARSASFTKIHDEHVRDEGIGCSTCHDF